MLEWPRHFTTTTQYQNRCKQISASIYWKIRSNEPQINSHEPGSFKCTSPRRIGFNPTNTTTTVKVRVQDIRLHKNIHGLSQSRTGQRTKNKGMIYTYQFISRRDMEDLRLRIRHCILKTISISLLQQQGTDISTANAKVDAPFRNNRASTTTWREIYELALVLCKDVFTAKRMLTT